jgi:YfiH family protein
MVMTEPVPAPGHDPGALPEPSGAFDWRQAPWGWVLECAALAPYARHVFTTCDLAPGIGSDPDDAWKQVAAHLALPVDSLWAMNQVHGCRTLVVSEERSTWHMRPAADAAVSGRSDVGLVVKTADCVPILLADRNGRGIAAIHAGWRGMAQCIIAGAVERMERELGVAAPEIVAAVGPSIGACCYEIGPEVRASFETPSGFAAGDSITEWFTPGQKDRLHFDLWRATADQLSIAGLPRESIHMARLCTACHRHCFFSYRRDGRRAGRMLAAIRKQSIAE